MRALRLNPPEVPFTPELRWVLARAFGPADRPFDEAIDARAAADLAETLGLAPRVGARTHPTLLASEAAAEAPCLRRAAIGVTASNVLRVEAARAVADVAGSAGIPFVVLKGLAIELLGLAPVGARPTTDLDLLVPPERIADLERLLVAAGWRPSETLDLEQHVDPLVHPQLGMVEIHRVVLGVRLPGSRRSVRFSDLAAAGLLREAPGLPPHVRTPAKPVLLAHSLVHGLVQHGNAPSSYPAFRVLGDVADLGPDAASLAAAGAYLRELDAEDLATVGALVRDLGSGLPSTLYASNRGDPQQQNTENGPDPTLLLGHLVAGVTDREYAEGLRASPAYAVPLSDLPGPLNVLRSAWRAVALSRAQVDQIYGRPRTPLGYLGRRLARPFDLAARWLRYAAARRKARRAAPAATGGGSAVRR